MPLTNTTAMPFDGYFGEGVDTIAHPRGGAVRPVGGMDTPAAVILETVQGEGGFNVARSTGSGGSRRCATSAARADRRRHPGRLGRTGTFFSFEAAGIKPDIITLSKSLSGYGLPMALVVLKRELDVWKPGEHNGTFRGNNHAFVTARAALQKFWADEWFARDILRRSREVSVALHRMADFVPGARVKGRGLMMGLDVGSGELASAISQRCLADGLIIELAGPHDEVVKLLPALTIPDALLAEGLGILQTAVRYELRSLVSV